MTGGALWDGKLSMPRRALNARVAWGGSPLLPPTTMGKRAITSSSAAGQSGRALAGIIQAKGYGDPGGSRSL